MGIQWLHEVYITVGRAMGRHSGKRQQTPTQILFSEAWGESRQEKKNRYFPKKIRLWPGSSELCGVGKWRTLRARQIWVKILGPHFQSYVSKQVCKILLTSLSLSSKEKSIDLPCKVVSRVRNVHKQPSKMELIGAQCMLKSIIHYY